MGSVFTILHMRQTTFQCPVEWCREGMHGEHGEPPDEWVHEGTRDLLPFALEGGIEQYLGLPASYHVYGTVGIGFTSNELAAAADQLAQAAQVLRARAAELEVLEDAHS